MAAEHSAGQETPDVSELRREVSVLCDAAGDIAWADSPATRLLGVTSGDNLVSHAAPGTEPKLARLLELAGQGPVRDWEVALVANGQPHTLLFTAAPGTNGHVLLVGNFVPAQYSTMVQQVHETVAELGEMQRESERQQRELQRRHDELVRLNLDLDDSARGMAALHAEVEESADSLRRLSEVKSRVVSNVSHEFRTPLNSIIGLTNLLLTRVDGEISSEQEKQITFIRRSAESLTDLVNDLLDLSSIEAGKVAFRPATFTVGTLYGALRGMMRPLASPNQTELVFDAPDEELVLETDEGKVSQVMRNLLSNALKFTPNGEVRVTACAEGNDVVFAVKDTGIGIDPADHERVFDEFTQLDSPIQRRVKGTGLGLALSRRLAVILGGTLTVESRKGEGSTFTLRIPRVHPEVTEMVAMQERSRDLDPQRAPILVLEDDRQTLFLYERYLRDAGFQILPARTIEDARAAMRRVRPAAIVLDVMLEGETSWTFLSELKSSPETRDIPTLVVTITNREDRARALGADEFFVKPLDQEWMVRKLQQLAKRTGPIRTILVVDDDEVARYMLRRQLADTEYRLIEAENGAEGLRLAQTARPQVIFLDFVLPGTNTFDLLDDLKANPATRNIPVIIHTSKSLADEEKTRLSQQAAAILPKQSLSREVALGRIRDALVAAGLRPNSPDREASSGG
ncbi:MAG TPA: response regulator [Luteitalea sp.]|nr:response regulator [Luteitalea sp.]